MQSSDLLLSSPSLSVFDSYPLSQRILFVVFLSVSSFGSEITLEEDPGGWVNIFLHFVVIMFCSVILSHCPFLSSVMSVVTDETQQQTLIYTGKICWANQLFFSPTQTWTVLYKENGGSLNYGLLRMLSFVSILYLYWASFLLLMTLFTPKSLSSSFLCSIRNDWSAITDEKHWLGSILITLSVIRASWINDNGYWAIDVRTKPLWSGREEREKMRKKKMRKVRIWGEVKNLEKEVVGGKVKKTGRSDERQDDNKRDGGAGKWKHTNHVQQENVSQSFIYKKISKRNWSGFCDSQWKRLFTMIFLKLCDMI